MKFMLNSRRAYERDIANL